MNTRQRVRAPSIAVVIPAYNAVATLERTLQSVVESIAVARENIPALISEIAVVDDGSTDDTATLIKQWAAQHNDITPVFLVQNRGPGFARNEGVRKTTAAHLFFLDADDIYYPNHIHTCLEHLMARDDLGYVFTKVRIDMPMHDQWRDSLDESNPINFCVRRVWHDMIMGFAEEPDFKIHRTEDTLYRKCLRQAVAHEKIHVETCEQFISPGNALDRQRAKLNMSIAAWKASDVDDGFFLTDAMKRVIETRLAHVRNLVGKA
ncbi:MAG: glycosyltransferase family A protein [Rhodospirillaceae bacterium]